MAKVKQVTLSFPSSGSPDVVGYKLYYIQAPETVDYESPSVDLGNNTSVDLSTLPGMSTTDGTYNLGVTAVDDAENESSMSIISNVELDFVAPDAPGEITVTRI